MSIFFKPSKRSISYQDVWGTGRSPSDILGTGTTRQLQLFAVYAATSLIADQFASSPWRTYRELPDGSRTRLPRQPSIILKPARYGSVFDWKFRLASSLLLKGNAVGLHTSIGADGYPDAMEWLNPDDCQCDDATGIIYWQGRPLAEGEFTHIPWYVLPGQRWGVSPLTAYALSLDGGLHAQQFGVDWFRNGSTPGAILKNIEKITVKEVAQAAKDQFSASVRSGELFVIGKDWDYEKISVSANESQFLDTIKATAAQIAAVYRVPPEKIGGEVGGSLTYATREQNSIDLSVWTMRPIVSRVEEAFTLLRPAQEYVKFNMDAIVRADLATRYAAHAVGLTNGWLNRDEVRRLEDLEPLPNGEGQSYANPAAALAQPAVRELTLNQYLPADVHNELTVPERSTTVNVDARTAEGAVQIRNEVDGTTAVLEGAINLTVPPAIEAPKPTSVRKQIERDASGEITAIIETETPDVDKT